MLNPTYSVKQYCSQACGLLSKFLHLQELDRDEEDEAEAAAAAAAGANVTQNAGEFGPDGSEAGLKPQDIDAYWLQREISRAFGGQEAAQSQKLANEVFAILKVGLNTLVAFCGMRM